MRHMAKYYEVNGVPTSSGHFPLPNVSNEKNVSIFHHYLPIKKKS